MPEALLEFASALDPGRLRSNNEDAVVVEAEAGLAVLADGMGGYNAGEVASGMATQLIRDELVPWLRAEEGRQASPDELRQALQRGVDVANRAIFEAANTRPECEGMGTTLVTAVIRGDRLVVGHIGDSRAYCLRQGRLQRITRDHSLLQEQIDAGLITPEEAAFSTIKNLVTRAMGVEDTVLLETQAQMLEPGDQVLLCSDGLSDMLSEQAIEQLLLEPGSAQQVCDRLAAAANEAGGRDNISVVLARVLPAQPSRLWRWWPMGRGA